MEISKFRFSRDGDKIIVAFLWNEDQKAVHNAITLELLSTTMPKFLEDEYIPLMKKNIDKIK